MPTIIISTLALSVTLWVLFNNSPKPSKRKIPKPLSKQNQPEYTQWVIDNYDRF